jgi:hypothetical protein
VHVTTYQRLCAQPHLLQYKLSDIVVADECAALQAEGLAPVWTAAVRQLCESSSAGALPKLVIGATALNLLSASASSAYTAASPELLLVQEPASVISAGTVLDGGGVLPARVLEGDIVELFKSKIKADAAAVHSAAATAAATAVYKFNCKRVMVFCASRYDAAAVCAQLQALIEKQQLPAGTQAHFLSGASDAAIKHAVLQQLKHRDTSDSSTVFVCTAQLWRAAVSPNACDLVVIVGDPMQWYTLVQMVGRCQRPYPDKEAGYVLLLPITGSGAELLRVPGLRGMLHVQKLNVSTDAGWSALWPRLRDDEHLAAASSPAERCELLCRGEELEALHLAMHSSSSSNYAAGMWQFDTDPETASDSSCVATNSSSSVTNSSSTTSTSVSSGSRSSTSSSNSVHSSSTTSSSSSSSSSSMGYSSSSMSNSSRKRRARPVRTGGSSSSSSSNNYLLTPAELAAATTLRSKRARAPNVKHRDYVEYDSC